MLLILRQFLDQIVDRGENRVERVGVARQDHPARQRARAVAPEGVEHQVHHLRRIVHRACAQHRGLDRADDAARRADGARAPERRFGGLCISPSARTVTRHGAPVTLTPREWAILDRLSHRPGQVVGKAELEDAVYGFGEEVESNAIEAHVSRLRAKLGRTAVETVRGFGYRMGQG